MNHLGQVGVNKNLMIIYFFQIKTLRLAMVRFTLIQVSLESGYKKQIAFRLVYRTLVGETDTLNRYSRIPSEYQTVIYHEMFRSDSTVLDEKFESKVRFLFKSFMRTKNR